MTFLDQATDNERCDLGVLGRRGALRRIDSAACFDRFGNKVGVIVAPVLLEDDGFMVRVVGSKNGLTVVLEQDPVVWTAAAVGSTIALQTRMAP